MITRYSLENKFKTCLQFVLHIKDVLNKNGLEERKHIYNICKYGNLLLTLFILTVHCKISY